MVSDSEKLFLARLSDMVSRAERDTTAVFSDFLDERQSVLAEKWCRHNTGGLLYTLWGGYENAMRKMLAVFPEFYEDYIKDDFPLRCVTFTYRKEDKLTHRDFLGTFMGMRLKREKIGDIITGEGMAQVFMTDTASRFVVTTVSKIGRTGVKCCDDRPFEMKVKQEFLQINGTVASLRLDCIVSLATGKSRGNAVSLIRSEKVEVNHFPVKSVSAEIKENDIISVRGFGRFILAETGKTTRKDRIHIMIKKFV